jgi:hypothetical protein
VFVGGWYSVCDVTLLESHWVMLDLDVRTLGTISATLFDRIGPFHSPALCVSMVSRRGKGRVEFRSMRHKGFVI